MLPKGGFNENTVNHSDLQFGSWRCHGTVPGGDLEKMQKPHSPECADPICGNMWMLCFVPIIGILYYLVAGETVGILAATDKASVDGIVSIKYGPLAFSYDEDHKLD